ncbi:CHAD domain-containing protein [Pseudomonas sp. GD03766]|nr:CHAD domain-containing protein [Pseudomonas sp. GD03766]MDH1692551.1 CHAD domain-containing protein [Pseudomonas sp. GD03766]
MGFVDQYVAEFVSLEVKLLNARERLRASTDDEALHDLRIAVRRIRSLLIPVRCLEGVESLKHSAAEVGRLTTPTRDLEVMAVELDARGLQACSGLLTPDTYLGENARHREVSDDQATPYLYP